MKKILCVYFTVIVLLSSAFAYPKIPLRFYLDNEPVFDPDKKKATLVLPNTLRLTLHEGESALLYADILPSDASCELFWSADGFEDIAELYPRGKTCTVIGVSEGDGEITVNTEDGVSKNIQVHVTAVRTPPAHTFEYHGDTDKEKAEHRVQVPVLAYRLLTVLGFGLIFGTILFILRKNTPFN